MTHRQTIYSSKTNEPQHSSLSGAWHTKKISASEINQFIRDIKRDPSQYEIFKDVAIKKGLLKIEPLTQMQHKYYRDYIRPNFVPSSTRNDPFSNIDGTAESYIPLRDLLKKNLDSKV